MQVMNSLFYSGTSGINLPSPRTLYPEPFRNSSRLHYYASLFNSIEVNSIFYKLHRTATISNWARSVPDDFRFTFKVSKSITHVKNLHFAEKDVIDFIQTVDHVGEKKGCLLVQFPPSLKVEKLDQLQRLLDTLGEATQHSQWKLAVEFRDPSWYEYEVNEVLEEYDAAMVVQDIPKSATPLEFIRGNFVYLRFHGPDSGYRGDYSDTFLKQTAEKVNIWLKENKTVYAYFNNTAGAAFNNLQTFNNYVQDYLKYQG